MRTYGVVSPRFWIGRTGRELRKHPYAQRIAMYFISAPLSEMTGVFYCPLSTILNDVGSPTEGASKGHQEDINAVKRGILTLQNLDFCFYDFDTEFVFVKEMAAWQIGSVLKPSDKRVPSVRNAVSDMPDGIRERFVERYNEPFSLGLTVSPIEAPSMPLRSQEQEQEQDKQAKACSTRNLLNFYGVPDDLIADWKKVRKSAITQRAIDFTKREAEKAGMTLEAALDMAVSNGWKGFKAEYVKRNEFYVGNNQATSNDPFRAAVIAQERAKAEEQKKEKEDDEDAFLLGLI